jgi:hypothetical protein
MKKILLFLLFALPFSVFGQGLADRIGSLLTPNTTIEDLGFSGKELSEYRDLYRQHKDDIDRILSDKSTSRREKQNKMREVKNGRSSERTPAKARGKVQQHPGGAPDNDGVARAPMGSDPRPASTRQSTQKPRGKVQQHPGGDSSARPAHDSPSQAGDSRPTASRRTTGKAQGKVRQLPPSNG